VRIRKDVAEEEEVVEEEVRREEVDIEDQTRGSGAVGADETEHREK
jgi:stress response protein YsnF